MADRIAMGDGMNTSQVGNSDELMSMDSPQTRRIGRGALLIVGLLLCGIYAEPTLAVDCCDATYKLNPECKELRSRCQGPRSSSGQPTTGRQSSPSSSGAGEGYSSGNTYGGSAPSVPTYSVPSSSGRSGSNAGEVLELLGTFLDIWGNAQQEKAQRAQEEYQRNLAEQQRLEEEEEERRTQQLQDSRRRQATTNPFATTTSPNSSAQNPFAKPQENREAPGRGTVAANPFRTEMARESSSSGIPKEQCISDLQRALLATKKAYLSNTKGATTLNDKSIAADFEIPRSSCPPVSKVNVYEQRRTFEDARALQYCASRALKCAIELVGNGADCKASMSSCQDKFVGALK